MSFINRITRSPAIQHLTRSTIRSVAGIIVVPKRPITSTTTFNFSGSKFKFKHAVAVGIAGTALTWYATSTANAEEAKPGIVSDAFTPLFILEKVPVNENTTLYRFASEDPKAEFTVPVASFILLRVVLDGKEVIRPYTPVHVGKGYFDLLIKDYPQGSMSKHLKGLKQGDKIEVKGPMKKIEVTPNFKKEVGLIAGGSGITPMYQVIVHLLRNKTDKTKLSLIYANVEEKDIWFQSLFEMMHQSFADRFNVHYVLEKAPAKWDGSVGYIQKDTLQKYLPAPNDNNLIMVCGPPGMMKHLSGEKAKDYTQGELSGLLKELGYTKEQVFKF